MRRIVLRGRGRRHGAPLPRRGRSAGDAGQAVVEAAIAIPVLLAVAAVGMWCIGIAGTAISAGSAAGDAARALARGEDWETVHQMVLDRVPGSTATSAAIEGLVTVTVRREVAAPIPILDGLGFEVHRSATASTEWTGMA